MRSPSTFPLIFLLSLATSSCAIPIPMPEDDCLDYASCRPTLKSTQSSTSPQLRESHQLPEPHFPAHQLGSAKQTDTVEVRLLEHHTTTPRDSIQLEPSTKNHKLNPVLGAARIDKASSQMSFHEPDLNPTRDVELAILKNYSPRAEDLDVKEYGFTAKMLKKVQLVSITSGPKCSIGDTISSGEGKVIITYTYGYQYIRTDYTSVLVVSIVATFFLIIVMVELLDKAIDATKAVFGLDQGIIRLEDDDCEHCAVCPPYSYTLKSPEVVIEPPPSYEGQLADKPQSEALEEKVSAVSAVSGDELV